MKNTKLLIYLISISVFFTAMPANALAAKSQNYKILRFNNKGILPHAEETEWHYRLVDGKWQKRLWSVTYGVWLTDWMPL
ncbi:MAG: hypothetical protein K2P13_11875 [Lachnospiraceae bacterium]|nr:hypothetical protein [Lachnospiraceae bacterium]